MPVHYSATPEGFLRLPDVLAAASGTAPREVHVQRVESHVLGERGLVHRRRHRLPVGRGHGDRVGCMTRGRLIVW